jgi:hypothetical protein
MGEKLGFSPYGKNRLKTLESRELRKNLELT